jgi:hypothetical protein
MITSIKCKCGNDLWEQYNGNLKCTNCLFTRPYIQRKPKPHTITSSQQKQIDRIRNYFLKSFAGEKYGIEEESIKTTDFGKIIYHVETGGNVYVSEGGTFFIGNKGKIEISTLLFATHAGLCKHALRIK